MREAPREPFAVDESVIEAMEAWGAPPEQIAAVYARIEADRAPKEQETFGVYAENMPVAQAFMDLRTQWVRTGFNGQRTGLNYAAVISWLALFFHRTKTRQQLMKDLQLMEMAVLQADHELKKEEE